MNELHGSYIPKGDVRPFLFMFGASGFNDDLSLRNATTQCLFRHASRTLPIKLSTKAILTGLPSWMKWRVTLC